MGRRNCGKHVALVQLPEVQASIPVGGIHNGHVQLFFPDHIHKIFRGTFCQMEPDPAVLLAVLRNFLCNKALQRTGDISHSNNNGGADLAVPEHHGGRMQLLQGSIDLFLIESAFICQTHIPANLLEEIDTAQLIFQIMNGAA